MYIVFFLLMAANLLAQETYVIDSVCVGAERTYRRDGEANYSYYWELVDREVNDTSYVPGVDFKDINGTDTTWGNEITHLWDAEGEFDIIVYVTTEHGCDTLEQGMVKVFPLPEAEVGEDKVLCDLNDIAVSGDTAWNYSVLYWTTTGDGTFSDAYSLHPVYQLGANDSLLGEVTLILTAEGMADNGTCTPAVDSLTFRLSRPEIAFEVRELLCYNDRDAIIRVNMIGGAAPFDFAWTGPDAYASTAKDSITGLGAGWYYLTVTDANGCFDIDSVEIVNPPELLAAIKNITQISCYGYSDGAIVASATGGTGALSFSWTSQLGSTYAGDSITGLPADTYYLTVTDENACTYLDTVVLPDPDLLLVNVTADDTILCEGEVVILHGNPVGGTGQLTHHWTGNGSVFLSPTTDSMTTFAGAPVGNYIFTYTITDEALCQATDSIELNVYPPSYSLDSMEVCAGADPFTWNNRTITSDMDRIYKDTLPGMNQYGCDSILTLDVKVLFPTDFDTTIYICENETPYAPYGNITILPDRDSIYYDTLHYASSGCDSLLITINVFTFPVTFAELDSTLCAGAGEFMWNNRLIQTDSSQVYLDTLVNIFGCDSLLTYDVTMVPPDTFTVDTTFCQGEPEFVWNGIAILTAFDSIYEAVLTNQFGCDSIVNLNVQLLPVTDTVIDTMLCYGNPPYAWNNLIIYAERDSTYLDTLVNQYGCDSLLTLNVTIRYPDIIDLDTTLCEGTPSFAWGAGHIVESYRDSVYTDTLQNVFGCDSIVNLDVKILLPYDSLQTVELCANELPYNWYKHTILPDRDSIYYDTLYYVAGCDSLRLQLEVITLPVSDSLIEMVLCEGSPSFDWNGRPVSTYIDSTYLDTMQNVFGCDSTITLVVDIVPAFKDTLSDAFCFGEPIADWYGQVLSSEHDSTYIHNVPGPSGCDTLIFYEITILPVTDTLLSLTLCMGAPDTTLNNVTITSAQSWVYYDTIPNVYGCDSTLVYDVTVVPPDTVTVYDTFCMNELVADWNSIPIQTQTDSIYQAVLPDSEGCDSVVILYTTIIEGGVTYDTVYACVEYTWAETGKTYTVTGDDYRIQGTGTACPDTAWLHVVISPPIQIDPTVADVLCYGDSTGTIDLLVSGGIAPYRYLWSTGDTTANVNKLPAGDYSVIIYDSLADSLACEQTITVTIAQPDSISIGNVVITDVAVTGESTGSIEVDVSGGTPGYVFAWTDALGTLVGSDEDLLGQPAGTYTLTVTDANNCVAVRTYTIVEPEITPCLDDVTLICYEDLANYPVAKTLEEYIALMAPGQEIDPGCGIDTASFTADSAIVSGSAFCYEEVRYYTLYDQCNGDTLFHCVQRVIVNDTEDPVIDCPADFSVSNGIVPDPYDSTKFLTAGGSFSDNCGIVSFAFVGEHTDGLSNPETITRIYEVADYCGNTSTCEQIITVYVTTSDPALDCSGLPTEYLACSAKDLPVYRTIQDFDDAGGSYFSSLPIDTFYYTDVVAGTYCPTITRTYVLRNVADQEATCVHVFKVVDNEAPLLNLPDVHIYCNEPRPRRYSGSTSVSDVVRDYPLSRYDLDTIIWDNCGPRSSIDYIQPAKNDDVQEGCPKIITRYYEIVDKCGNEGTGTQRIFIYDTVAPVITNFPYEITADCDIPPAYTDVSAYVSDDCGPLGIAYRDSLGGVDEQGVVYRIYTFSDPCNSVEVIQKITIELTNVPVLASIDPLCQFTVAPALPATSVNNITGYWLPDTISTAEAGTFEYIFYPDSGQCAGPASLTIEVVPAIDLTATAIDQGYNPNPVGSIDLSIEGGSGTYTINWTGTNGYSANTEDISNLYAGRYFVEVRDEVGCYDSLSLTLIAQLPEIACPPDTVIECPDLAAYPPAGNMAEFEALGGSYIPLNLVANITSFDLPGDRDFCLSLDRYYVIEDIYGRRDTCVQHVDFYDIVPPVLVAPEGDTAECLSSVVPRIETLADFLAMDGTDAYDNCTIDPASFTVRDTAIILSSGGSQVIYYFSISDFCGNTAYDTTYYLVTDDQAPEVFCADLTVYLNADGTYSFTVQDSIGMVDSLYDNCTAPEDMLVYIETRELTCEDIESGFQVRVTVVDEAGLSAECMANITVVDTIPPEAICQDITVYLDENGEVAITAEQINNTSTDNCSEVQLSVSKDRFDCTDVGENTVELTVTDIYGNSATCEGIVTVIDEIPPVITCVGKQTIQLSEEDGTYTLSWEIVTESADDECGIDTILLDRYVLDCDDIGTTFITVTAYDVNGNENSCLAEFEIFGNIPPNVVNDTAVTAVDVPVDINVVLNDYDLKTNINISSLNLVVNPIRGSVAIDKVTGIVTYTPDLGFVGQDVFRYTICDDGIPCEPECGTALVFVTVRPANQPPDAVNDYYDLPCGNLTGNVALNDSDPDGDNFVVNPVAVTLPVNGTLTLFDDGHFEYEPFFDFEEGVDSFQYEIWDEGLPPSLRDTAWVYITRVADHDCDGVADVDDIDDDNDGIRDLNEGFNPDFPDLSIDSDQDGIPDYLDIDSDNDGIVDNIEGQGEHDYVSPDGWRDQNNDGWDDRYDPNYGGYAFDENLNDHDQDGMPDYIDIDSDNDNVFDFIEGYDYNADGIPDVTRLFVDTDGDGLDDAYDTWIDTWGNDIDNEVEHNAPLQDFDGDGWRDWRDTNDEDDEYMTADEDINGDGDYSNDDLDLDGHPEYLDTEMDCELFIPEGFSPNDDGVHDFFQILCIYPRYPNAKMMIFNRNGQKLWEKDHYGNYDIWGWNDAWWWGTTDSRFVIGRSGGLPAGNYIYVLELNDGTGEVRNGTVMLAY